MSQDPVASRVILSLTQDHRKLMNGIAWLLRLGASWQVADHLQTALDVESNVDWEIHFVDATTALIGGPQDRAISLVQRSKRDIVWDVLCT